MPNALLTAASIALLVIVAPDITSTSVEFASTIFAGSLSIAFEPIPEVSFAPVAMTLTILSPSIRTDTDTSPPKPFAVPVNVSPVVPTRLVPTVNIAYDNTITTKANIPFFISSSYYLNQTIHIITAFILIVNNLI